MGLPKQSILGRERDREKLQQALLRKLEGEPGEPQRLTWAVETIVQMSEDMAKMQARIDALERVIGDRLPGEDDPT